MKLCSYVGRRERKLNLLKNVCFRYAIHTFIDSRLVLGDKHGKPTGRRTDRQKGPPIMW
jgi:hypothetical protein